MYQEITIVLKSTIDKLDVDKLVTVPVDLSTLSNIVCSKK